jgi:hypothetical protein
VARFLRDEAKKGPADAWGADRRRKALYALAEYILGLPLDDPRLYALRRGSVSSDNFRPTGGSQVFALIGLNVPPPDSRAALDELAVVCTPAAPEIEGVPQEKYDRLAHRHEQEKDAHAEAKAENERQAADVKRKNQELSDLRGKLKRTESGELERELESLRRQARLATVRAETLETELDAATRAAPAAIRERDNALSKREYIEAPSRPTKKLTRKAA